MTLSLLVAMLMVLASWSALDPSFNLATDVT